MDQAAAVAQLRCECVIAESLPVLAPDVEQCIYRIAQEAVINAVYHAAADTLTLQLSCSGDFVVLMVQDNGRGFNIQQDAPPRHFGIAGMYERAALAGGELAINSNPSAGTTVSFRIQARSSGYARPDLR
jgi:two-component system NarL family sensor kinase